MARSLGYTGRCAALALALAACTMGAHVDALAAQLLVPFASEFLISPTTRYERHDPAVAITPDGSFIVVWMNTDDRYEDGSFIYGRRFSALTQSLGETFQVDENTLRLRRDPHVAYLGDGSSMVVWRSIADHDTPAEDANIFGRGFGPDGEPVGPEFVISTHTAGLDYQPTVEAVDESTFVAAWVHTDRETDLHRQEGDLFAQRLASTGERLGTEFRINTPVETSHTSPSIAALAGGGFVVAWSSVLSSHPVWRTAVLGQTFDTLGGRTSPELVLGPAETGHRRLPSVAALTDGGFVVAWGAGDYDDEFLNPGARDVVARRFSASGTALDDARAVHADPTGRQVASCVAATPDNGYVVVWGDGYSQNRGDKPVRDGDRLGLYVAIFDGAGVRASPEFQINSYTTGNQWFDTSPTRAVATDARGNFVAVWISGYSLVGRRFCRFSTEDEPCGDADCVGAAATATDALLVLQSSVGLRECASCICDADASGDVSPTDALRILRAGIGFQGVLNCPPCT